jgi:glycosyltransferase involved in cell wall biosynthesis
MSLKIGMILDRDFPPDDRPEKEAISLIQAGHEVNLLCYTATNKPLKETYKGIKITRFHLSEKVHKKLSAAYLALPLYRWLYTKQIKRFIIENNLDVLHIHDLPMTDIGHRFAQKYNLKIVCDQHEYWSNWIGKTYHYNTFLGKIVKFISDWKKYEYKNLISADLVITVSDRLRQLYIEDVGLDPQKIITVPNTPASSVFQVKNVDYKIVKKYDEHFMLFYAGAIDILRGLDLIVQAIALIKNDIPELKFVLAGRFARGCNLLELAESLDISTMVEYLGWLQVSQLPSYIAASKLCVYTPPADTSDEINNTIHTKLYQYVAMKKPIIISQAKMMRDFVIDNNLGFEIGEQNPGMLAKKILHIYQNYPEVIKVVQKQGQKLIDQGEIFWDQTVRELIEQYKRFEISDS